MRVAILALPLLMSLAAQQVRVPSDKVIIEGAQQADVASLDKTLKKQHLDAWLKQALGPGAKIEWSVTDCGEGTGSPADRGRDLPICAEALAKLPDGRQVVLEVAMGSHQKGIDAPYGLYVIAVTKNGQPTFLKTLSELAARLRGAGW